MYDKYCIKISALCYMVKLNYIKILERSYNDLHSVCMMIFVYSKNEKHKIRKKKTRNEKEKKNSKNLSWQKSNLQ